MRKIKKILMAMVITSTLAAGLYGCGKISTADSDGKSDENDSVEEVDKDASTDDSSESETEESSEVPEFKTSATIEPTVLLDQDGIKITADELTYTGNSPELSLTFENNTDKNLSFISGSIGYCVNSVNGYMIPDIYINSDVTPGNKSNESVSLNYQELQLYGINEIAEIQLGFDISDDDYNQIMETGPLQIKTSAFGSGDFSENTFKKAMSNDALLQSLGVTVDYSSEDVLYDDGGVKVDTAFTATNSSGEKNIFLDGFNSGSSTVYLTVKDIEANGIVVSDGIWKGVSVNPNKHAVLDIDLDSAIKDGSVSLSSSDVSELKFKLVLLDDRAGEVAAEKEVTLTLGEGGGNSISDGEEVYNQDGIKFSFMGKKTDDNENTHFTFYIENTSGKDLSVRLDSLALDGTMVTTMGNSDVENGKTGSLDVELYNFEFEDAKINPDNISKAEFTFEIKDDEYNDVAKPVIDVDIK